MTQGLQPTSVCRRRVDGDGEVLRQRMDSADCWHWRLLCACGCGNSILGVVALSDRAPSDRLLAQLPTEARSDRRPDALTRAWRSAVHHMVEARGLGTRWRRGADDRAQARRGATDRWAPRGSFYHELK
jgi:hypothetical protein